MTLRSTIPLVSLVSLVLVACASDPDPVRENGNTVFESDGPGGSRDGKSAGLGGSTASMDTGAPQANNGAAESTSNDAARAIEEADIIKISGTRLYALSQYGGLSIIDMANRDHMRLLGRKKVQAQPFEMYVRDQVVFALYNGYGEYIKGDTEGQWRWVTTSYVIAFDTTNPEKPSTIGRFSIPGAIQDSRIVGNALYVVGFENNSCWGCAEGQHTTVISLDISNPAAIRKVDERSYADDTLAQYSWKRSIAVTDKRMYIAGPEYGTNGPVGSAIQVVDISDPTGKLVDGVQVPAAGQIDSRWQMDESDGVLRVISQPGNWRPSDPPRIQTFGVTSAQSITKLASVDMVIPPNETLRSVRFDGPRGYAITAEQTDPLFTIDLSNAAQPKQVGELEMPGWIYYMEPRGERLVALGYDQGNAAGALTVSLFDVSNLATPTMLDRVNFGGNWSWMVEDQDRIHKAFQVLDSANLVLMPFSGYSYDSSQCYGKHQSGVQLIDWAADKLTLQGVAPTVGQARRGFLYDSRLYTVSDERVEAFDVADRSQPKMTDSLKLTEKVTETVDAGTAIVKVGQDWYSNSVSLETTTLAAVESPAVNGHIDVPIGTNGCHSWSSLGRVLAKSGRVYLLVNEQTYDNGIGKYTDKTRLVTVDVTNPAAPALLGNTALDFGQGWNYWYNSNLVNAGASATLAGDAIVALGREDRYSTNADGTSTWDGVESTVFVIDPKDPSEPKALRLPTSLGTTGLLPSGTSVALGHYEKSPSNPERVRFYLDRIDVSNAKQPALLAKVNVPGSPVAYDAASSNALTVDYKEIRTANVTAEACRNAYPSSWFEYAGNDYSEAATGTCHSMQQTLNLVNVGNASASVLGSKQLEVGQRVSNVAVGDDRVFLSMAAGYGYYYSTGATMADCMDCGGWYRYYDVQERALPLVVMGGIHSGEFSLGQIELSGGDYWSYSPMVASGKRALLSTGWRGKLVVVDGSDAAHPAIVREAELYGSAQSLTVAGGVGIASLYYDGVQTIAIE